jgi:hypothetical protein
MKTLLALLALTVSASAATYRNEPAAELKNGRYELSTDMGGYALGYDNKFKEIEKSGLQVRVKDICASACTIVLRNPKACAERGALFGFHQVQSVTNDGIVYSDRGTRILWSYYPDTVKAQVKELTPNMVWIKGRYLLPPC